MSQDGKKEVPFGLIIERAMDTKARDEDRKRALESPGLKAALEQVAQMDAQAAKERGIEGVETPVVLIGAPVGKTPSSRPPRAPVVQQTERMDGAGDPSATGNETMHGLGPPQGAKEPPSTPTAFATSRVDVSQVRAKEPARAIDRAQERWKGGASQPQGEADADYIELTHRMAAAEAEVAAERAAEDEQTPVRRKKAAERRGTVETAELNTTSIHAAMKPAAPAEPLPEPLPSQVSPAPPVQAGILRSTRAEGQKPLPLSEAQGELVARLVKDASKVSPAAGELPTPDERARKAAEGPPVPLAEAMAERSTLPMGVPAVAVPPAPVVPAGPSFPPAPSPLGHGGPMAPERRPATVGGNTQRLPAKEEPPAANPWAREAAVPQRPDPRVLPSSSMPAAVPVEKEPQSTAAPGRRILIGAPVGKAPSSRPPKAPVVQQTERMDGAANAPSTGNETMLGLGPAKSREAAPPSTPTAFAISGADGSQVRAKEPARAIDRAQERWKGGASQPQGETDTGYVDLTRRMAAAEAEVAAERAAEEEQTVRRKQATERREPAAGAMVADTAGPNTTSATAAPPAQTGILRATRAEGQKPLPLSDAQGELVAKLVKDATKVSPAAGELPTPDERARKAAEGPPVPPAEAMSERSTLPMGVPAVAAGVLPAAPAVPPAPVVPAGPSFPPAPSPLSRGGPMAPELRPATVGGNTQRLPAKEEPPAANPWAREAMAPQRPDPKVLPSSSMPGAAAVEKEPRSAAAPGRAMVWTVAIVALVLAGLVVAFIFRPTTGETPVPAMSASAAPSVVPAPSGAPAPPAVSSIAVPPATATGSAIVAPPPQSVSASVAPSPAPGVKLAPTRGTEDPYDSGAPRPAKTVEPAVTPPATAKPIAPPATATPAATLAPKATAAPSTAAPAPTDVLPGGTHLEFP
jgi:hypothetical protein